MNKSKRFDVISPESRSGNPVAVSVDELRIAVHDASCDNSDLIKNLITAIKEIKFPEVKDKKYPVYKFTVNRDKNGYISNIIARPEA